jgi:hypothetical protein
MTATARKFAFVTALTGWGALVLQYAIMLQANAPLPALWRFLGYFTILTNLLVAVMATGIAAGRAGLLGAPPGRMAVTAAIVLVGAVYWLLLAALWQPEGAQLIADFALHSIMPILAAFLWWTMRDGTLAWRDVPKAAIWPAAYACYALARGQIDGWYAYWFFDPSRQDFGGMAAAIIGLSLLVAAIGAALVAIDRRRAT